MKYRVWRTLAVSASCLFAIAVMSPQSAIGAEQRQVSCQEFAALQLERQGSVTLGNELSSGDVVYAGDIAVQVPGRDQSISITASRPELYEGVPGMLNVSVSKDGVVEVRGCGSDRAASSDHGITPSVSPIPECQNTLYNLLAEGKWNSRMDWYFKMDTSPAELNSTNVETALRNATNAIQFANNSCGRPDNVGATALYQGVTSAWSNLSFTGGQYICTAQSNGLSTVDFAGGPAGVTAAACTRGTAGVITESDIRFNNGVYDWIPHPNAGCTNRYSIRAVGTHERGHSFGLGHVGGFHNSLLTMFESGFICHDGAYTLGLGDMLGLEFLY